jgi:hypothetical protein
MATEYLMENDTRNAEELITKWGFNALIDVGYKHGAEINSAATAIEANNPTFWSHHKDESRTLSDTAMVVNKKVWPFQQIRYSLNAYALFRSSVL